MAGNYFSDGPYYQPEYEDALDRYIRKLVGTDIFDDVIRREYTRHDHVLRRNDVSYTVFYFLISCSKAYILLIYVNYLCFITFYQLQFCFLLYNELIIWNNSLTNQSFVFIYRC